VGNIPAFAAEKRAFRRLRLKCELHSATQSEVLITHTGKKKTDNRKGCLFSFGRSSGILFQRNNIPALAAGERAFRRLRLKCELHSATQSEVLIIHTGKKKTDNHKGCLFSFWSKQRDFVPKEQYSCTRRWRASFSTASFEMRTPFCYAG